jgi:hypothetical protein
MGGKRKRVFVSSDIKVNAIKHLDQEGTTKNMASDLGVGEVAVGNWRREREEIEKMVFTDHN